MVGLIRNTLLALSRSSKAQGLILSFPLSRRVARRFVPGERLADALAVVDQIKSQGMLATLDHLGENVTSAAEAAAEADAYIDVLNQLGEQHVGSGVSVKLTNFGLDIGDDVAYENLKRVVDQAGRVGRFVRIDMEDSPRLERTLAMYRKIRTESGNVGIVLQTYLHRTPGDIQALVREGIADIRLVKGAYQEPASVARQGRSDVRASFEDALRLLWSGEALRSGARAAVATHDTVLIRFAESLASERGVPPARFEFQLLYGVRRNVAARLARDGYRVRLYVPFGTRWYGYFMRRIAERPANLVFFLRALVGR